MAKPRVYWRGLHSGTHQRDHYYTSLPQRPKCIHLNPIHWGIEILPSTKLLLLIICQNLFSLLVLFHLVYAVTLVITLIYSFSHFLWCPTRNGTVEILPVDDLYQDGISNNILCLKMEPKYNTVFIAGKKMLHRSGAGKLRIHFFTIWKSCKKQKSNNLWSSNFSVHKVLLEHIHANLFTYCLRLLLSYKGRAEPVSYTHLRAHET